MNSKSIADLIDTSATLEQLENDFWGDAPVGSTRLVTKSHVLRKKKLSEFEIEDYRLLISQNIGLQFLIPLAMGILNKNAFAEGDFYEGDLLKTLLESKKEFWRHHSGLRKEVIEIFETNKTKLHQELDVSQEIKEKLLSAFNKFADDSHFLG